MNVHVGIAFTLLCLMAAGIANANGAESPTWVGYGGPGGSRIYPDATPPTHFADDDVVWGIVIIAGHLKHQPRDKDARWIDPGFVDPLKGDFRLKPDSPLADRADDLPTRRIDPQAITERHRMRRWVGEIPEHPRVHWTKGSLANNLPARLVLAITCCVVRRLHVSTCALLSPCRRPESQRQTGHLLAREP